MCGLLWSNNLLFVVELSGELLELLALKVMFVCLYEHELKWN